MGTAAFKSTINNIMSSGTKHGLSVFAWLEVDSQPRLKKFLIDENLRNQLIKMLDKEVRDRYLTDDIEIDSSDNIEDKRRVLYEFQQTETYAPFGIINGWREVSEQYVEADQKHLRGLLFRVNRNDDDIWIYQRMYNVSLVKRSKSLLATVGKTNTYVLMDSDVLRIDPRIDVLVMGSVFYSSNIALLQKSFGFDSHIRSEAEKTIQLIDELGVVSDTEKIMAFGDKETLSNAKKLMKAKNSPVLKMEKKDLLMKLRKHPRYKDKFKIQNNQILINSQRDAGEFIKMLNDDILRSELTDREYDSPSKKILEPLDIG